MIKNSFLHYQKYTRTTSSRKLIQLLIISLLTLSIFGCKQKALFEQSLTYPLEKFSERPKLLTFGLYVTPNPDQNPIDPPERFTGYHTALDIEIFENEQASDVTVSAICDGEILLAKSVEGYGGTLIHSCKFNDQDLTVLYGHLDPQSFTHKIGEKVQKGDKLGMLSAARSAANGFNRKHLHLGIHKGKEIELAGYVQTEKELETFIEPAAIL